MKTNDDVRRAVEVLPTQEQAVLAGFSYLHSRRIDYWRAAQGHLFIRHSSLRGRRPLDIGTHSHRQLRDRMALPPMRRAVFQRIVVLQLVRETMRSLQTSEVVHRSRSEEMILRFGTRERPNEARHRMSGNNINLKFEHRDMPLLGALCR